MEAYSDGDLFDITNGHFIPYATASDTIMASHDTHLLFLLNGASYETMDDIAMNRQDRARMIQYLATYYAIHIPKFPTLQSLEILQQLI